MLCRMLLLKLCGGQARSQPVGESLPRRLGQLEGWPSVFGKGTSKPLSKPITALAAGEATSQGAVIATMPLKTCGCAFPCTSLDSAQKTWHSRKELSLELHCTKNLQARKSWKETSRKQAIRRKSCRVAMFQRQLTRNHSAISTMHHPLHVPALPVVAKKRPRAFGFSRPYRASVTTPCSW